jgi:NapC/NirT cytochrome c family protein
VAIPAVFVAGLLLVPAGVWLQRQKLKRDTDATADWPVVDFRRASVRRTALVLVALTALNFVIVLVAGYGMLHWMESPNFCGQVCHTPMHPQFTAWRTAAHARIACVQCHIGEGAASFAHAKLSGLRQLVHVVKNSYPRPVPAGTTMPPGAQAGNCLGCHQPTRFRGDQVRVIREYADDEANTESVTVLQMHVGGAPSVRAIHWHANPGVRVEYVSADGRKTIPYVRVTDANGNVKEYTSPDPPGQTPTGGERHTMDCSDCHNRVGHPISPTPERAVDDAIAAGHVSRQLPHVRQEAVKLLKAHATDPDGPAAIEREMRAFYKAQSGPTDDHALARSVAAIQNLHRTNVFPVMNVTFGTYPTNLGHITSDGCFRCHDGSHAAKDGSTISSDCEYCHRQIETPSGT